MDFSQIIELLNGLQAKIQELQEALADGEAFAKAQYDQGFADGVASVPAGGDVQAQIDAAVALAVAPLNAQIEVLNGQVADLQAQLLDVPAQIAAAAKAENDRVLEILRAEEIILDAKVAGAVSAIEESERALENKLKLP